MTIADVPTFTTGDTLTADKLNVVVSSVNYLNHAQASLVSDATAFTQTGTGATTRTVSKVLQERLRVTDFGAVGDGATDSTAAIAKCMAQAAQVVQSEYWGDKFFEVEIPPGFYVGTWDVPVGSGLVGHGQQAVVLSPPAGANRSCVRLLAPTSAPAFNKAVYQRQTVRQLSINGYASAQTAGHCIEVQDAPFPITTTYQAGATIVDVRVNSGCQDGIYLGTNRDWCFLDRVISNYNGRNALSIYGYDNRINASDFGASQYGIVLYGGGANEFQGCNVYTNSIAGFVKSDACGVYNWFIGGSIGDSGQQNVYLTAVTTNVAPADDVTWFYGTDFGGCSGTTDATYAQIQLVNGAMVGVKGGRFRRTPGANRPNYLVRALGTGTGLVYWSDPVFEQSVSAAIPYTTGVFGGSVDVRGSYSFVEASGVRYRRHPEVQEFLAKLRMQDDSQPANYRAWIIGNASQTLKITAASDDETNLADALVITRGLSGSTPLIQSTRIAGTFISTPPASVVPGTNGDMVFELTSNTQLKVKVKGSDGTVRSTTLTLA
jgi:hypothetical protein